MKAIYLFPAIFAILNAESIPDCLRTNKLIEECVEQRIIQVEQNFDTKITVIEEKLKNIEEKLDGGDNLEGKETFTSIRTTLKKLMTTSMKMKSTTMMPTEKKEEMTTHEEIRTTKMNPQKMTTKVIGSETNSPSAKENFSTTTTTPVIENILCSGEKSFELTPNCKNPQKYILTTENYPQSYPFNYQCSIQLNVTGKANVTIEFEDFHVEEGQNCPFDKLIFTNSSNTITLCGRGRKNETPSDLMTTNLFKLHTTVPLLNKMYHIDPVGPLQMQFFSDAIVREKGFKINVGFVCDKE